MKKENLELELLLLEMWKNNGVKEIYKYKNRISEFVDSLSNAELIYDVSSKLFEDIKDVASSDFSSPKELKVSVEMLIQKRQEKPELTEVIQDLIHELYSNEVHFTAKISFPFGTGMKTSEEEEVVDINVGEIGKIVAYDAEKELYTVLNLNLAHNDAWFKVSREELLLIVEGNEKDRFLSFMGSHLKVHESGPDVELETWTDGGVNMFITLDMDAEDSLFDQFIKYVEEFDIDEQIDVHREDKLYKSHFSYSRSIADFEGYREKLKSLIFQYSSK